MNRPVVWILMIFLIISPPSWSEYRVFTLKISKKNVPGQEPNQDFRLVESTLDPEQYRSYYPLAADEEIAYTETWLCRGRTSDFLPHCPNPKGQIVEEIDPAP